MRRPRDANIESSTDSSAAATLSGPFSSERLATPSKTCSACRRARSAARNGNSRSDWANARRSSASNPGGPRLRDSSAHASSQAVAAATTAASDPVRPAAARVMRRRVRSRAPCAPVDIQQPLDEIRRGLCYDSVRYRTYPYIISSAAQSNRQGSGKVGEVRADNVVALTRHPFQSSAVDDIHPVTRDRDEAMATQSSDGERRPRGRDAEHLRKPVA